MCGIAITMSGVLRCEQMLEKMKHRGEPGTANVYEIDGLSIGHVRLPIIELSTKQNQPMGNDNIIMAFNGEIYNYEEIDSTATSDTEVLFKIIDQQEFYEFERIDGMYAIVWYEISKHRLHVITDHLCKKPLYMNLKTFEIASEIKALVQPNQKINMRFLANVSRWGLNPNEETIFEDITQFPPNVHCVYDTELKILLKIEKWVNMDPIDHPLDDLIIRAVENRLVSDVPISFLLSGGLDSSIVCYLASCSEVSMNTFYIDNGETGYSKMMAETIDANHKELILSDDHDIEKILYYNESPVDLGSVVPQYLLCQAVAKEDYKVVITGDGADELFGGYTRMSIDRSTVADTQYHDIFYELPYYHCQRLDKMSMAHTVELRSPFLSKDVIRGALNVPYKKRIGKQVLKDLFRGIIPREIIDRPKLPLRSPEMKIDREEFKFRRMQQFTDLINKGVYWI